MSEQCDVCRFWHYEETVGANPRIGRAEFKRGLCRRYAPRPVVSPVVAEYKGVEDYLVGERTGCLCVDPEDDAVLTYSHTFHDWWCGEFQAKTP